MSGLPAPSIVIAVIDGMALKQHIFILVFNRMTAVCRILLLVISLTSSLAVATESVCQNPVSTPEIQNSWSPEHFSNPAQHNPEQFRYIVHMIDTNKHSTLEIFQFVSKTIASNPCAYFSASLISQNHKRTFGLMGFIIKAPAKNILVATGQDFGSDSLATNTDPERFHQTVNRYLLEMGSLQSPESLLKQSSGHNEVLISGSVNEPFEIVGIMVKLRPDEFYMRYQAKMLEDLRQLSVEKNLPIIYLGPWD